jgi:hypothetical protein
MALESLTALNDEKMYVQMSLDSTQAAAKAAPAPPHGTRRAGRSSRPDANLAETSGHDGQRRYGLLETLPTTLRRGHDDL